MASNETMQDFDTLVNLKSVFKKELEHEFSELKILEERLKTLETYERNGIETLIHLLNTKIEYQNFIINTLVQNLMDYDITMRILFPEHELKTIISTESPIQGFSLIVSVQETSVVVQKTSVVVSMYYLFKDIRKYKKPMLSMSKPCSGLTYHNTNKSPISFISHTYLKLYKNNNIVKLSNTGSISLYESITPDKLNQFGILTNKEIVFNNETERDVICKIFDKDRTEPIKNLLDIVPKGISSNICKILSISYAEHIGLDLVDFSGKYYVPFVTDNNVICSIGFVPDMLFSRDGKIVGIAETNKRLSTEKIDISSSSFLLIHCLGLRLLGVDLEFADFIFYSCKTNKVSIKRYDKADIIRKTDKLAHTIVTMLKK